MTLQDIQPKIHLSATLQTGIVVTYEFLMAKRQAMLMELDALERLLEIAPRTAELRRERKEEKEGV